MHFATILEGISDQLGERDALVHGALRRSWRESEERAARLASAFAEAGLTPGKPDREWAKKVATERAGRSS
ncbi:MAG: hypothetical protein QNK03_09645 [Myxococcota bacterium]|nr:hypothetical protein [Myxococcota bacterium]